MYSKVTAVRQVTLNHLKYVTKKITAENHRYFKLSSKEDSATSDSCVPLSVLSPSVHDSIYSVRSHAEETWTV